MVMTVNNLSILFRAATLLSLLNLTGCIENIRGASSTEIRQDIAVEVAPDNSYTWKAPELLVRHFRVTYCGYDRVYYRLSAVKPADSAQELQFRLVIDANYGLNTALKKMHDFNSVKFIDGSTLPITNVNHDVGRCQMFCEMYPACLYRDRADVELSLALLEASRHTGLVLTLASAEKDFEQLDLPAEYIDGFLQAVQNQK
jgi:hypothetical protein